MIGSLKRVVFFACCLGLLFLFAEGICHAQAFVATGAVGYHTGPGPQYPRLGTLRPGQSVMVTRRYGHWFEIALTQGAKAYVPARFLRPANNAGYAPVPPPQRNPGYRPPPPPPGPRSWYAAFAYSNYTRRYGYGKNQTSKEASQQAAIRACGRRDCRSIGWVKNGCIALATNNRGGAFSNWGGSPREAQHKTLGSCKGYGCKILETVCTNR